MKKAKLEFKDEFNHAGFVSEEMKQLISKMLVFDEDQRIGWKEIFN